MKTSDSGDESTGAGNQRLNRRLLEFCWREAREDYRDAGAPFGASQRAFELWIMYEQRTTRN